MKQTCSYENANLQEVERSENSTMQVNFMDDTQTSNQLTTKSYRKGTRFIFSFSIILFVHIIFCSFLHGQDIKIKLEEYPDLAKKFKFDVPEGKALFVFEGKEDYSFSSGNENIVQPKKVGSIYTLLVSADSPSGIISVFNDDAPTQKISYGMEMTIGNKSLPPINSKDIKYFKISMDLGLENVTDKKKREGYLDQASHGDKDNLIILFPTPKNLDLQISGETTQIARAEDRSYRIYVKPEAKKLDLISKGFNKTTIELGDSIGTKNTFYFDVRGSVADEESVDATVNIGDFLLKTDPPGALIELKGNPSFNEQKHRTPYPFKGYEAGPKMVHLTLDKYEPNDVIIVIGGKKNNRSVLLEPKFAFLNAIVEPAMPISKVLLDGKELFGIENGKKFEIPKGTHSVEITAPHYYSQTKQINPSAGQLSDLKDVKLRPKMGTITIEPGENTDGAEVFINEKSIGKLPIRNYSLQEGDYTISYKKSGVVTELDSYSLTVNVNVNKPIKSPPMINLRKIKFSTDPQSGATVYINGIEKGTTPLSLKQPVGTYKVLIKKDNYKDFSETINLFNERTEFNYSLTPNYNLSLSSTPSGATVSVDGQIMGNTPIDLLTAQGTHRIIFTESSSIRRVKHITTDNVPRKQNTVLRKDFVTGFGFIPPSEGVKMGGEVIASGSNVALIFSMMKLQPLIEIPLQNNFNGVGYAAQIGYRIPYPLDIIIHGGYGSRVFTEKDSSSNSSSNNANKVYYETFLGGITLQIHLSHNFGLYAKSDYWLKTENGNGLLMFSGGIMF